MRLLFVLITFASFSWAKVSINPSSADVLVNQCFVLSAHFSEAISSVRSLTVMADHPTVRVFASPDCSGGPSITVSGALRSHSFSVMPVEAARPKVNIELEVAADGKSQTARAKIVIK